MGEAVAENLVPVGLSPFVGRRTLWIQKVRLPLLFCTAPKEEGGLSKGKVDNYVVRDWHTADCDRQWTRLKANPSTHKSSHQGHSVKCLFSIQNYGVKATFYRVFQFSFDSPCCDNVRVCLFDPDHFSEVVTRSFVTKSNQKQSQSSAINQSIIKSITHINNK